MITGAARKRQRVLVAGLHGIVLAILAIQTFVRQFPPTATAIPEAGTPEAHWWGVWPATYLPDRVFAAAALSVLALVVVYWWRDLSSPLAPFSSSAQREILSRQRRIWYLLVGLSVLMVVAFYAFPIVHTRWGDAYILSRSIAWPDTALRLTRSWQAPLDVFLHSSVWLLVQPFVEWPIATPVYRILSPLAGAIFLFALLMLSRNWRFAPNWLTYGLVATLGLIQLFFGYIENYSFAAAFVLVYLWLGISFAQDRASLWPAAAALAFANALHPSTVVLGPSLLYLAWIGLSALNAAGNNSRRNLVIQVVLPFALVYGFTWIVMEMGNHGVAALFTNDRPGGGDARWLVPIWQTSTEWERYTMFSWPHLRDFLNEQFLIAPAALPSLLWIIIAQSGHWQRSKSSARGGSASSSPFWTPDRPVAVFLAVSFVFYLAFTWMWNPDYGGQRDWDLFSLVAIPQTLLLVYALSRTLVPRRYLAMGAAPLIAVQALHTASWIYQNTLPWSWP